MLSVPVWPSGNVEDWLREVEKSMKSSLRDQIQRSLQAYPQVRTCQQTPPLLSAVEIQKTGRANRGAHLTVFPSRQEPRTTWVLSWPGQVVIAGCQTFWTTEVSGALEQGDMGSRLYPQLQAQVRGSSLVRPRLLFPCFVFNLNKLVYYIPKWKNTF